jgi:addiction module RelE/StbE family toxin
LILAWSALALADRDAIFDYIEQRNPLAAVMVDDRIGKACGELAQFPELGRPGRIDGTRELIIADTPYIVAYAVAGGKVRVLRVLHGARRWPTELTSE